MVLSRRTILKGAVAPLVLLTRANAQSAAPIPMRTINHVHLIVSNLQRSLDFYQKLFGLRLAGMQGVEADWSKPVIPMLAIGGGPQFMSFSEGAGRNGGRDRIDHFGFGIENFNADRVVKMLGAHGIKGNVRMRADSKPPVAELKFQDPDNITVQIQDVSYCGGSGALGNQCSIGPVPKTGPGLIPVRTLNHFTLSVSNVQRSVEFYERVCGMRLQYTQGTEADWNKKVIPELAVAGGHHFLAFSGGGANAANGGRIDHFCLGMEGFVAERVQKILAGEGLKASIRKRADSDPPAEELMFTDPDGIRVQIQDASYCGGEGVLGNRCR